MRTLLFTALILAACEGPAGPAGPPGTPGLNTDAALGVDALVIDDGVFDQDPPDALPDQDAPDQDQPTADCPPWTAPPGFGGPANAILSLEEAERWQAYRTAREQERMEEAWKPARVRARYRIEQAQIEDGCIPPNDLVDLGRGLFTRTFTPTEGFGDGSGRLHRFQRGHRGGPDASRCLDCHWKGGFIGAGDRADNSFSFGDGDAMSSHDSRNPPALWGVGWAELIAREMTAELQSQAETLRSQARNEGRPITVNLTAKGTIFGQLTAAPDGTLDTSQVQGIDPDLVVKPLGWKGVFPDLRGFIAASLNLHLSMQAEALIRTPGFFELGDGPPDDPDGDGVTREITDGQLTALVAFLATLDVPKMAVPTQGVPVTLPSERVIEIVDAPEYTLRWLEGAGLFSQLGCATCHTPFMPLENTVYTSVGVRIDLAESGALPHPVRDAEGQLMVPVFSDFKRHAMGPHLAGVHDEAGVPADTWLTRRLWGVANTAPYLHTGGAATFDEAIIAHGGEAEFASNAFRMLSPEEKSAVRIFLHGLRRGPAVRVR